MNQQIASVFTGPTTRLSVSLLHLQHCTALQVYNAVQKAAAIQANPSAQSAAKILEEAQMSDHVCESTSDADKDPKQCTAPLPVEVPVLVSGAGHDSLAMADLTQASVTIVTARCDLSQLRRRLSTA